MTRSARRSDWQRLGTSACWISPIRRSWIFSATKATMFSHGKAKDSLYYCRQQLHGHNALICWYGLEDLKYGILWPFAPKSTYVSLLKTSGKVYTSFSCCLSGKVWFSFSVCVYFCEVILKISRCKILNNIFYLRKNGRKTINYSAYFELWICSRIQDIADTGQVEKNIISNEVDCELMCSEVCRTSWKHREVYCE